MGAINSKMLRVSNVHCLKYDSEVLMHWICTALNINHVKKRLCLTCWNIIHPFFHVVEMKDRCSALGLRTVREYATSKSRQTPHALTPLALDNFGALSELPYSDFRVKYSWKEARIPISPHGVQDNKKLPEMVAELYVWWRTVMSHDVTWPEARSNGARGAGAE